ncbi:MAG TPA: helix-turn-helix domain-containing protein [Conexibacter sp.]|jgi:AcrR family transcriptional regulator
MTNARDIDADPPLRRDAERNRRLILDAAASAFAERGLGVTMDEIAQHAGVGVGTVYRRFPNKEDLIDALFVDRLDEVTQAADEGLAHEDPWDGLVWFLERSLQLQAQNQGLKELVSGTSHGRERVTVARERLVQKVRELVDHARAAGTLREDFDAFDTPVLQTMLGSVLDFSHDVSPELWRRFFAIVLDGLRARRDAPTPLPAAALDEHQLDRAMAAWKSPRR